MKRSVEMYLRNNIDLYENIVVSDAILSEDMRKITIIVSNTPSETIETLNNSKRKIADYCRRYFRTKYLPVIKFILYENLDI